MAPTLTPDDDPNVSFRCPPPPWFHYVATSVRQPSPQQAPPPSSSSSPSLDRCPCRDAAECAAASSSCPCLASVRTGLHAIDRDGPDAVVLLVECGGDCKCGISGGCRPTQGGLAFRVEVAVSGDKKGRGLFASEPIPKGRFVLEYAGEVVWLEEAARRLAAYDAARQRWLEGGAAEAAAKEEEEPGGASGHALMTVRVHAASSSIAVAVDATVRGNAARFANHACGRSANLGAVLVKGRSSRQEADAAVPLRVALFSTRAIAAGEELTICYGDGDEGGDDGLSRRLRCACGSAECSGWLPSGG